MRNSLIAIALLATSFSSAQAQETDSVIAERLVSCAAAHTINILILQESKRDDASLYRQVGFFKVAGEAFSSNDYAEKKYAEVRAQLNARMDQALAEPAETRTASAQKFLSDLHTQLRECAQFANQNKALIGDRIAQSGLLR